MTCLKTIFRARVALLALALLFGLAVAGAAPVRAGTFTVNIVEPSDDSNTWTYEPVTVTIAVGDSVTWTNRGAEGHDITAEDGSFVSGGEGNLNSGDTFTYTFTQPGTFPYLCQAHPWMRGTVVVQ